MGNAWEESVKKPRFESLKGDLDTEVLIIGGGITGILCGYELWKAGVDYTIVEANEICSGVTHNTTAKITFHHGAIFHTMVDRFGEHTARLYVKAQNEALERYKELCKNIDCDFEVKDSYVYSLNNKAKIKREVLALRKLGIKADYVKELNLPFKTAGAVRVENQAQFNPLKFLSEISKELTIYENTKVTDLVPGGAVTNHGKIKAESIIVATHFPFLNKHGGYFLKLYQYRSYEIALNGAALFDDVYVDENDRGMSFRSYNGMLLVGGGGHRTGKNGGNWQELSDFAKKYYPKASEVGRWATQDCMSLDKIPYIGKYSKNTPNLYVATGFSKWGMTGSMTSAIILCDLICGKQNPYADIFSPQRRSLFPQLAINGAEAVLSLLTPTVPRCPHMGCALKYNKAEHTWDCPCHGSRFEKDGRLINNPATDDKK